MVRVTVLATVGQVFRVLPLTYWIYPATWGLSALVYVFLNRRIRRQEIFSTEA